MIRTPRTVMGGDGWLENLVKIGLEPGAPSHLVGLTQADIADIGEHGGEPAVASPFGADRRRGSPTARGCRPRPDGASRVWVKSAWSSTDLSCQFFL